MEALMKLRGLALAIAMAAATQAAPASAAALLTNGGFETGDFTGWNRSGALALSGVDGTEPRSGDFAAFFSPNMVGSIAQSLATLNSSYRISFWLRHTVATAVPVNSFSYSWGGTVVQSFASFGDLPYTRLSANVAGGGIKELKFDFRDTRPTNFYIDDISLVRLVDGVAVPEPSTWALLVAGFGLSGAMLRRRRAVAA